MILATLIALTSAIVQTPPPPPLQAPAPAPAASQKKVCRAGPPTGSRIARKDCRTAAEWADADANMDKLRNASPSLSR